MLRARPLSYRGALVPQPAPPLQQDQRADRSLETRFAAALLLLLGVLWLTTRQYHGIVQDSRLYTVQALDLLLPHRFSSDLYLRLGSQDNFTVYSYVYGPLIAVFGISRAAIIATIAGDAIWLCGLAYLSCSLFESRLDALLAIGTALALPGLYWMDLGYGESLATPRAFAEGLVLFALGLMLRRRHGQALCVIFLAMPLHPLIALAGLAFALIYLPLRRPIWLILPIAGTLATAASAIIGIKPFVNLKISFDQTWFDVVKIHDTLCLITQWPIESYCRTLTTTAIAIAAACATKNHHRQFLINALLVGLGGILCTLIGGDVAHNVLITQLQPWRSMWLLTLVSNLYVASIVRRLAGEPERLGVARVGFINSLFPFVLSQFFRFFIFVAAPLMVLAASIVAWQLGAGRRLPVAARMLSLIPAAAGGIATTVLCGTFIIAVDRWPDVFRVRIASCLLMLTALASVVLLLRFGQYGRWNRYAALPTAIVLLVLSLYVWDGRDPWARFVESPAPVSPSLIALVPPNATVYWEGGMRLLWLRLKRPSYFACDQGTGVVFFRNTAVEFDRREHSFKVLRPIDFGSGRACRLPDKLDGHTRNLNDLRYICGRERSLDYLVLALPVKGIEGKTWIAPVTLRKFRQVNDRYVPFSTNRFYVYSCAELR